MRLFSRLRGLPRILVPRDSPLHSPSGSSNKLVFFKASNSHLSSGEYSSASLYQGSLIPFAFCILSGFLRFSRRTQMPFLKVALTFIPYNFSVAVASISKSGLNSSTYLSITFLLPCQSLSKIVFIFFMFLLGG